VDRATAAADGDAPVLLLGERGTGKAQVARRIHARSARYDGEFITIRCGTLPAGVLADRLRAVPARRATLFLDGVDALCPADQDALAEFMLGDQAGHADVRLIAAGETDPARAVKEGRFREDLSRHLGATTLRIPPLRERSADIPLLTWYFVRCFCEATGRTVEQIPESTMGALRNYDWPGNETELRCVIERALLLTRGNSLAPVLPTGRGGQITAA
jgi:DNA-binding NtrC family response regulator